MLFFHIFYTLPLVISIIGLCIGLYKDIQNGGLRTISPKEICQIIGLLLLCFIPAVNFIMAGITPITIWGDDFYDKIGNWFNSPIFKNKE